MNRYFDNNPSEKIANMSTKYRQVLSAKLAKIDELVDATNRHILQNGHQDANKIYSHLMDSVDFIVNNLEITLNNIGLVKEIIDMPQ